MSVIRVVRIPVRKPPIIFRVISEVVFVSIFRIAMKNKAIASINPKNKASFKLIFFIWNF